jgi:ubiquinone/menaquinone biosynthesis C-methylase UbiE
VDYDQIAGQYDAERYRAKEADPDLHAFLRERGDRARDAIAVLDVGCGTGNQLVANRAHLPGLRLVGLDLFRGMLSLARFKSVDVHWVQADGARLPFAGGSFDYLTNQFSFHHVRDKRSMIAEVYRVLRLGGRFVMTNICPREMPGWAVYRYFPAAWARDLGDFLPKEDIRRFLVQVGFDCVAASSSHSTFEDDLNAFIQVVRARTTSQLVALSEAAYRAGLRHIEGELRRARGRAVSVQTESCILKITGVKDGNCEHRNV